MFNKPIKEMCCWHISFREENNILNCHKQRVVSEQMNLILLRCMAPFTNGERSQMMSKMESIDWKTLMHSQPTKMLNILLNLSACLVSRLLASNVRLLFQTRFHHTFCCLDKFISDSTKREYSPKPTFMRSHNSELLQRVNVILELILWWLFRFP